MLLLVITGWCVGVTLICGWPGGSDDYEEPSFFFLVSLYFTMKPPSESEWPVGDFISERSSFFFLS